MNHHVAILLAPGFEEAEAIIIIDVLRRIDIPVVTLSCDPQLEVNSYHDIPVRADALLAQHQSTLFAAVVLPGGPQGTVNLAANPDVIKFIQRHDEAGKWICPICSAAARVLGAHQLLKGRRYTCSGDLYQQVTGGVYVDQKVVEDRNLISGKGLGVAFDFAFYLAWRLTNDAKKADFQAKHIYYDSWRCGQ